MQLDCRTVSKTKIKKKNAMYFRKIFRANIPNEISAELYINKLSI